jgi:serine/threonine protein phosphatase PrpC
MKCRFPLEFASKSDTGRVRSHNEDAVVVSANADFAVLADGMGGYNAGEVASNMATAIIEQVVAEQLRAGVLDVVNTAEAMSDCLFEADSLLIQAIEAANLSILEASLQEPDYRGMGTTVVIALFHNDGVTIAHVGDSRAYRLRDRVLVQITRDHSLLQEQLDAGLITVEQARFAQHKNLITRAVGVDTVTEAETNYFDIAPGDCYLLCSDGLSDMLSDIQIAEIVNACGDDITTATRNLVAQANDQGGRDNISVVLVRVARTV